LRRSGERCGQDVKNMTTSEHNISSTRIIIERDLWHGGRGREGKQVSPLQTDKVSTFLFFFFRVSTLFRAGCCCTRM
jgi:hypothetical protein